MAMAHHEMQDIKELDIPLLTSNRNRLYFYFAERDDWVGGYRDDILKSFEGCVRVVQDQQDIPHAFCISKYSEQSGLSKLQVNIIYADHGEQVGLQCHEWLTEL